MRSRLFTVTFHSKTIEGEGKMEVKIRDAIGTDIDNVTNQLILKEYGNDIERGDGYRVIELESPNVFSWSYGFINESDHPMNATINLSESDNLSYSTKIGLAKKNVEAKQC